jgi:succinate-semialdehyde dehydrogenase/glutarate-semialdehyde dehydrogenase
MYPELSLLIGGEWTGHSGRKSMRVVNPATGEKIGQLPVASPRDIDRAARAAESAFAGWKSETPLLRARILLRIAELLRRDAATIAPILTMEQGKTLGEAQTEIIGAADIFEWMAEEGKRAYGRIVGSRIPGADQMIFRQPIGPVAAFAPWNFPVILSSRKIATALAAGCTVVIKPAEETPGCLVALARICIEAGLPPGVLNVVFGEPSEISEALIKNPIIRKVSFTGSVPVGRHLATLAGKELKKITLELGGHSPVIVMPDVDAERLADISVAAKFRNAGQICFSPTRYFVHKDRLSSQLSGRSAHLCEVYPEGAARRKDRGALSER